MSQAPLKVALCGPPHSGKSCLREGLKQALMVLHRAGQAPYPYVLTACPDGEGSWYSEAAQRDPVLANQHKAAYKAKFTWEFTREKAKQVQNLSLPLSVIDMGGLIDEKSRYILQYATHAVILAGDMSQASLWKEVCADLNVQVIALLHSDYEGTCDRIDSEYPVVTGSIHHLERGEDVSKRPMVQVLAKVLVGLVQEKPD